MTSSIEVSMLSESTGGLRAFCGQEEKRFTQMSTCT